MPGGYKPFFSWTTASHTNRVKLIILCIASTFLHWFWLVNASLKFQKWIENETKVEEAKYWCFDSPCFFTTALFFCWSCPMDVFCRSSIYLPSKLLLQHEKNDQHQILSDNLQIETWNKVFFYFILLALPWGNIAKINWRYTNTENTNLTIHQ